ncbi:sulfatase family protein [Anatilimnocola floriformis]|uniref:sulfatase family protein n=1 Tax=Anatilimnocola floriformis TaxID=2948575 RepID=UPI0020C529A8|nr:sulfatase [Anatilimnocola floriformis]
MPHSPSALRTLCLCGVFLVTLAIPAYAAPNIVLIFCDDLGYADIGCYGAKGYTTPHLDQMAKEGVRATDFEVAAAVCSASRAALMTGCYPQRVGILGALGPNAKHGIAADEKLLPELLKEQGYATAIFGKWHLGHHPQFLPQRNGFDRYFGLPYSNDMWPNHPTTKTFPPLPLIDGEKTIETNPDQTQLTTWYTERAVKFIEESKDKPFFLYVPHSMPHVPLFVSDKHRGKTENGLFGDVITEIDWSVGQILGTLKRLNLDDNTLVMFASDNGPWLSYGNHAGSAGVFREGKGTTWEGGHRVPFIARWPGKIPAGRECNELCSTIDILPTCVKLAGGKVPDDRIIDGKDIWPLLTDASAKSPHEVFYYYWDNGLDAIRSGEWKLHFPHAYRWFKGPAGKDGLPNGYGQAKTGLELYNLKTDPAEKIDVAAANPEVVARLQKLAEVAREDLGDSLTKREGKNRRAEDKLKE